MFRSSMFFRLTFALVASAIIFQSAYASAEAGLSGSVFLSPVRVATLKARLDRKAEPTWTAWQEVKKAADAALSQRPHAPIVWKVPFYYKDPQGAKDAKQGLQDDANAAYALALAYRMTGEERYAQTVVRLASAWSTEVQTLDREGDSALSFSYHFPALIFAADLLRNSPSWPAADQEVFARFVREKALGQNTMDRGNNWGNWGLVLYMACAACLKDRELLDRGIARWKELVETQVAEDGHLPHEVNRAGFGRAGDYGIWYSHFCLMPQAIAAEIARVNGIDLYEYQGPSGRTLRQAYQWLAPYVLHPETFPYWQGGDVSHLVNTNYASYFEILQAHWPNDDAAAVVMKLRPMTANHSAPFLTFTHGDLPTDAGP